MAVADSPTVIPAIEIAQHEESQQKFSLPVDSEHKARTIRILSFAQPHMRSFHLAWFCFLMTFFATFAASAFYPVIRENINATKTDLGTASVTSVVGTVVCRIIMGTVLDTTGPRIGAAATVLIFAPAVFCMSLITSATGFIVERLFIGCSLAMFVVCQFWVGTMFNVKIVGTANAIAGGWGNAGAGACLIIMPLIYQGIKKYVPGFQAWRWAFFVPGGVYILIGMLILFAGQDCPDGDYRDLKKSGRMAKKAAPIATLRYGLSNYRTLVLAMTYGYCYGVELTVYNTLASYLFDQFEMPLVTAGSLAGVFGLMNIFARATGGMLSDMMAARFGMRGRLWTMWICFVLGGAMCLTLGLVDYSQSATIAVMIFFAIFSQQASGAHFAVVPFVSRRSYGVVSGCVGAGGSIGAIILQTIFFAGSPKSPHLTTQDGFKWMGVVIIGVSSLMFLLKWPMWGSMLSGPQPDYVEEDYYMQEWTAEEVAQGLHGGSMKFAMESRSMRGSGSGKRIPVAVLNASNSNHESQKKLEQAS